MVDGSVRSIMAEQTVQHRDIFNRTQFSVIIICSGEPFPG